MTIIKYLVEYRHPALGDMTSQALTSEEVAEFVGILGRLGAEVLRIDEAQ